MTTKAKFGVALATLGMPLLGWADTLSPSTFSATLGVGESTTIHKTLTITPEVTSAKVDVFFLFDTTGSMGSEIANAQAAATSIHSSVSGLGDVQFAVGEYKDGTFGGDPFQYRLDSALSASSANFSAGLGLLSAGGGGDYPESGLNGTVQMASTTPWRAGSTRIAIMLGDAPSHEGAALNPTRATTLAALNAQHIIFNAINYAGLNDDPVASDGVSTGGGNQATFLASSTGGSVIAGGSSVATLVTQIQAALAAAFATYSSVSLDLSSAPAGVTVTDAPTVYTGAFDRSITRTFGFDVTFTGTTPGTYDFPIYGVVGTGRVATELDHIVVGGGGAVPEPSTYGAIAGLALCGLVAFRRLKSKQSVQA
jgi:hypothetical protein